jgi:hypothetical protein
VTKEEKCSFQENPTLRKISPQKSFVHLSHYVEEKLLPSFLTFTNLFLKTMTSSNGYFLFSLHFHIDNFMMVAS